MIVLPSQNPDSCPQPLLNSCRLLVQLHHNVRYLHIFSVLVINANLKDYILLVRRNGLLGDSLDQLAELHGEPVGILGFGEEACIEKTDSGAQHGNAKTLALKVVYEFLKGDISNLKTIPKLVDCNIAILALVRGFRACNRFAEAKERQCKVDEAVLVLLNVGLSINNLVKLEDNQSSHKGCSCSNCRNNLSCNELGLVSVSKFNLIVLGTQVAGSSDEGNVMIGVIVLLKLNRLELEA